MINMNNNEKEYLKILQELVDLSDTEESLKNRTDVKAYKVFGRSMTFDLSGNKIPLLTTKKINPTNIFHELLWMFILKNPDTSYLDENGVNIWNQWKVPLGDSFTIGEMYGQVLRNFKDEFDQKNSLFNTDQLAKTIDLLKTTPQTRRAVFSLFDPRAVADESESFKTNVEEGRGVLNNCFTKGHYVQLQEGNYKDISEVSIGDTVLTYDGSYQNVSNIFKTREDEIFGLKIYKTPEIFTTSEHPFYVEGKGWVEVKDLEVGDFLKIAPISSKNIIPNFSVTVNVNQHTTKEVPIKLSKDFMFFLGYYIGNGIITGSVKTAVQLSVPDKKLDLVKTNLEALHLHYRTFDSASKVQKNIIFNDAAYATFISKYFYGKAHSKFIPEFLYDLPVELIEPFLEGYYEADGCKRGSTLRITTVSPSLAFGISRLYHKIGKVTCNPLFQKRPPTCVIEGRTVNQRDTFSIECSDNPIKSGYKITSEGVFYKLQKKSLKAPEDYNGYVYNLTVDVNHTYTVNNMSTHNCHGMVNQFDINSDGDLEFITYQRSADVFLGIPYNIVFYSTFCHMVAQVLGLKCTKMIYHLGNTHLYENCLEQAKIQLSRDGYPDPILSLNPDIKDFDSFRIQDLKVSGYLHHGFLKAPVAV